MKTRYVISICNVLKFESIWVWKQSSTIIERATIVKLQNTICFMENNEKYVMDSII